MKPKTNYWKIATILEIGLVLILIGISIYNERTSIYTIKTQYGTFNIKKSDVDAAYKLGDGIHAKICPLDLKVKGKPYCFQFTRVK